MPSMPIKTDYVVGDFVMVNNVAMPAHLRGLIGKVVYTDNSHDENAYPIGVDLPRHGDVGFEYYEVQPATDVEILRARLIQ